jgi:hypothetical protein
MGWNEPTTTNAPIQDEAIQGVLGINQKHILFPCPRFFQLSSLPHNFPLLPTSTHFVFSLMPKFRGA